MATWTVPLEYGPVMVVGGGSGIGQALSVRLSALGADVFVLGRRMTALQETVEMRRADGGRIVPIVCDARDPDAVAAAMEEIEAAAGVPQAVVDCAIEMNYLPARALDFATFQAGIAATLHTAFNVLHQWSAALFDRGLPGSAVLLTSCMAARGTPGIAHSSAGKAGIESFARSVAREWAPNGLRVNVVGPGFFPTDKSASFWGDPASRPIRDLIAMERLGGLDEIVEPIVFLLSSAASYITGQVLSVDGGFSLTPWVIPAWEYGSPGGRSPGAAPPAAG